ncbi:MAG: ATP-dependent Clp protease adaptor ClpS [Sandaracinaceae bacterium]|nr:ATP-dependent Clp protease adaptor ClpS [Sandaracinaceae bacterium]
MEALRLRRFAAHGRVEEEVLPRISREGPCCLVLRNDPYTTFEFVVSMLERYFDLARDQAAALAIEVHRRGSAEVALDDVDRARSAVERVRELAREACFPLAITIRAARE